MCAQPGERSDQDERVVDARELHEDVDRRRRCVHNADQQHLKERLKRKTFLKITVKSNDLR